MVNQPYDVEQIEFFVLDPVRARFMFLMKNTSDEPITYVKPGILLVDDFKPKVTDHRCLTFEEKPQVIRFSQPNFEGIKPNQRFFLQITFKLPDWCTYKLQGLSQQELDKIMHISQVGFTGGLRIGPKVYYGEIEWRSVA